MAALLAPIFLLGLADSLNPATIAVAGVLAAGRRPVPRLLLYTAGTGVTYFLGGLLLVLGPAELLHSLLHHKPGTASYVAEAVVGALAVAAGVWLWTRPTGAVQKRVPTDLSPPRAFLLGAGITLVDLPTALMYFGAIALITDGDLSAPADVGLLVVFNVAYVVPLLGIALVAGTLGPRAEPLLARLRDFVARWGHRLLAVLTAGGGVYLLVLAIAGLVGA
jgi:cytochrome c biogenesis protein CcdA